MNRSNGGTDLKEPVSVARHITDIFNFLSSTDISDALDRLGIQGQPIGILPLWQGCPKVAGPAATLKLTTNPGSSTAIGTLEAMEVANRGDIMVVDNDGRIDVNSWGSMASFCAQYYGLAGCVIDGATRDVDEIRTLNFPVFVKGIIVTSVRNRVYVEGYNIPVKLGNVLVNPGDFVFADDSGVIVVPRNRLEDAIKWAQAFNDRTVAMRKDILRGVPPIEAHKGYDDWIIPDDE